ncbi:type II toxin-antitoxin system PemK/MazF family toxin [Sporolactobacillus sp. THM19-2]|uniref:type II toxin-antitoxin system PemK/MazF family toxin n=1 Tax=Sporolactobacillus sp. THM19-2 TaxID=2511171 RepID=UPI0034DCE400
MDLHPYATTVLLITSDKASKDYDTNVTIEKGITRLNDESYIICAQPYTLLKSYFDQGGTWCACRRSSEIMDEIDESIYNGLCMEQ